MQDSRMTAFLLGIGLPPIGWVLFEVLGGRSSQEQYRSDEDLYTLLSLVAGRAGTRA
ncbi:hypothetical protein FBY31_3561 [Arthrobacter sp. SLBN-100]|nr:hypothetical protein FBY31_3561 [Arthrobacter sp. SLBN-100]